MNYGRIKVHRFYRDFGFIHERYHWDGAPIAQISSSLLHRKALVVGDDFDFGPFPVRIIDVDQTYNRVIVIRTDSVLGLAYKQMYRLQCWWRSLRFSL